MVNNGVGRRDDKSSNGFAYGRLIIFQCSIQYRNTLAVAAGSGSACSSMQRWRSLTVPRSARRRVSAEKRAMRGCSLSVIPIHMFVFISHLTVPDDDHSELERHFRERSRLVDALPGFLYLQLLRPEGGSASHTFLTAWESRQAFSEYMRGEEHRISHSREPREIMARTTVRHEAFEVLMDSRHAHEWAGRPRS